MIIKFYSNSSPKEKLNKAIGDVKFELDGRLLENTSVIDPSIEIKDNGSIFNGKIANYMYIEKFNRYYYINNYTVDARNIIRIDAHVDVLMSFKNYIKKCEGIVKTSENGNYFIDDKSLISSNRIKTQTSLYPKEFDMVNPKFILMVAGS